MSEIQNHWADIYADKIIREKGDKEIYTCASGITPSGTVHIGNFREIISVELVVRALRAKGKNVRFIYSWDDYDEREKQAIGKCMITALGIKKVIDTSLLTKSGALDPGVEKSLRAGKKLLSLTW